jgi:hypothetical protein
VECLRAGSLSSLMLLWVIDGTPIGSTCRSMDASAQPLLPHNTTAAGFILLMSIVSRSQDVVRALSTPTCPISTATMLRPLACWSALSYALDAMARTNTAIAEVPSACAHLDSLELIAHRISAILPVAELTENALPVSSAATCLSLLPLAFATLPTSAPLAMRTHAQELTVATVLALPLATPVSTATAIPPTAVPVAMSHAVMSA